jgi:hypothetical protein
MTDQSLTRGLALVWLHLVRMLASLRVGHAPHRTHLDLFSRFLASLLIIRAARRVPSQPKRKPRPLNTPRGLRRRATPCAARRALIGSSMRRRLRGRDTLAHIAALIRAILNLDHLTAALARRFARRLTRLYPLVLAHAYADALSSARAPRPEPHDSS